MAPRWQLLQPHYLNVPGTTWEYKEANRTTGKPMRREFQVAQLLDPNDPGDCNYRDNDDPRIIVSTALDDQFPNDIIFVAGDWKSPGQPTPDMKPINDEARKISESYADKWKHPIETLPGQSFSQALVDGFQMQMAEVQAKPQSTQVEGMTELLSVIAGMMKQNQEVLAELRSVRPGVSGGDVRRV